MYFSGTICMFVLHGTVHDLVRAQGPDGKDTFVSLSDFLGTQVFGSWDVVLGCDLGRGLRAIAGGDSKRLQGMVQHVTGVLGLPAGWSRDPEIVELRVPAPFEVDGDILWVGAIVVAEQLHADGDRRLPGELRIIAGAVREAGVKID